MEALSIPVAKKSQVAEQMLNMLNDKFIHMQQKTYIEGNACIGGSEQSVTDRSSKSTSLETDISVTSSTVTRKRLSDEVRLLLERLYERKRALNSKERHLVAKVCGLSPRQVRVWVCFTSND